MRWAAAPASRSRCGSPVPGLPFDDGIDHVLHGLRRRKFVGALCLPVLFARPVLREPQGMEIAPKQVSDAKGYRGGRISGIVPGNRTPCQACRRRSGGRPAWLASDRTTVRSSRRSWRYRSLGARSGLLTRWRSKVRWPCGPGHLPVPFLLSGIAVTGRHHAVFHASSCGVMAHPDQCEDVAPGFVACRIGPAPETFAIEKPAEALGHSAVITSPAPDHSGFEEAVTETRRPIPPGKDG